MSRLLCRLFSGHSKRLTVANSSRTLELSDLGDLDLLCLMDVLPLEDLMRLGCTNHRFNQLAKRRQPARRQLLLVIGPKLARSNHPNVITVRALTNSLVNQILSKLPSIVDLWIVNCSSAGKNIEPTIYLLGCLSSQLQTLLLHFNKAFDPPTSQQPLFAAINRLEKLTNLKFIYKNFTQFFTDDEPAVLHLPIISQLAVFQFTHLSQSAEPVLLELIEQATATAPSQIVLHGGFNLEALDLLLDVPPGLASRFSDLAALSYDFNLAHLEHICDHFSNLTKLTFSVNHLTIGQISLNLVKLSRLSSLCCIIHFPTRIHWRQQPDEDLARFGELAEPDVIDSADLVPLPAVTELMLCLFINQHEDLALLHLSTLFPNLTSLDVYITECVPCGYIGKEIDSEARDRCFVKLIKYCHALPQLQELKVGGQVIPGCIWKPLPLLGVCRFQLREAIKANLVEPVNKITTWVASKFTSA